MFCYFEHGVSGVASSNTQGTLKQKSLFHSQIYSVLKPCLSQPMLFLETEYTTL